VIVPSSSSLLMSRVQVYGRRLTALILDSNTAQSRRESARDDIEARAYHSRDDSDGDDDDDEGGSDDVKSNRDIVPFGDNGRARLASVKCRRPR
jgi:hypothetical protein